jgi:hypothetical protein
VTNYRDELDWAYHGEVFGEALFAAMAEAVGQPEPSIQLGLLTLIERQTKEQLAPLCDREGVTRNDAPFEEQGRKLAERSSRPNWDWERFLRSFAPLTEQALLRYRLMRDELAPDGDAAAMRALVTHEEVLQALADGLLAGDEDPARRLVSALEGDHRRAADELLRGSAAKR